MTQKTSTAFRISSKLSKQESQMLPHKFLMTEDGIHCNQGTSTTMMISIYAYMYLHYTDNCIILRLCAYLPWSPSSSATTMVFLAGNRMFWQYYHSYQCSQSDNAWKFFIKQHSSNSAKKVEASMPALKAQKHSHFTNNDTIKKSNVSVYY